MISIKNVLAPVSKASPCGEDLADAGEILKLEAMSELAPGTTRDGKRVEGDYTVREPNWVEIERLCETLLSRSRDLRVAAFYTAARLRNNGFQGLAEGLELMVAMLEKWGARAYPTLDATKQESVLERLGTIVGVGLAYKYCRNGDLLRVVEGLRRTPIASTSAGEFSHASWRAAHGRDGGTQDANAIETFKEAVVKIDGQKKLLIYEALQRALAATNTMSAWIAANLPDGPIPSDASRFSLQSLKEEIQDIQGTLNDSDPAYESFNQSANTQTATETTEDTGATGDERAGWNATTSNDAAGNLPHAMTAGSAAFPQTATAPIQSREDAVRRLTQVRDYLVRMEPSCPANFFIERAIRLVGKNFLETLSDLLPPESTEQFEKLAGIPTRTTNSGE